MMANPEVVAKWQRQRCKGYIETWVTRPRQPLRTVSATIETIARKHSIPSPELHAIVDEVRRDSVDPFIGPPWHNGPQRQGRLEELVAVLREKGIL